MLWINTVRHLRVSQVVHRARLRAQRLVVVALPGMAQAALTRAVPGSYGWPDTFIPIDQTVAEGFPDADANAHNRFAFLNEERDLGVPHEWAPPDAERLWRYHLNYFEWGWTFAGHPEREWAAAQFERLWRSWAARTSLRSGDVWSPYVASVRAWALCGLYAPLVSGRSYEHDFVRVLGFHAGFVRAHVELDVGGNHLIKNVKALIGLGVFLDAPDLVRHGIRLLSQQLPVQVLSDGGHYERSPSYHCQVLGDLIDVHDLLAAGGFETVDGLDDAIASMRRWLGAMLMPDGNVPLFNDCTLVHERRLEALRPVVAEDEPLVVLQPSGYVVMKPDDRIHLVADVGPPCPPDLPAHAHADCLSFELAVDGRRVIVDTGTSTYSAGERRRYERSTAAHNTIEIDDADQTEVWGAFRAARLAQARLEQAEHVNGVVRVVASHNGYRSRLPGTPIHRRSWIVRDGEVTIDDEILGSGLHNIAARLFFSSFEEIKLTDSRAAVAKSLSLSFNDAHIEFSRRIDKDNHALEFGMLQPVNVLRAETTAHLPLHSSARLQLVRDDAGRLYALRNGPR
jgi:hypothetical protein